MTKDNKANKEVQIGLGTVSVMVASNDDDIATLKDIAIELIDKYKA